MMIRKTVVHIALGLPLLLVATMAGAQSYNADTNSGKATTGSSNRTVITSSADSSAETNLIMRQQQRMDMFDSDLKALRGSVEQGIRDLQMQLSQMSNSATTDESEISASIRTLQDKVEQLSDSIAMIDRRMQRTLEFTSDVEFRLLRMEKRMQTLMTLGGDKLAGAAVQDDILAPVQGEEITMQRNMGDGTVTWTVDENKLNEGLDQTASSSAQAGQPAPESVTALPTDETSGSIAAAQSAGPKVNQVAEAPKEPQILPKESPDEQYRFALGKALQNDLETAELAFAEFREFNKGHAREPDAAFWLGRVQFMRGDFQKAAKTFVEFNSEYPGDARIVDTTMWIAESVSQFAPSDQACEIYASLPGLIDSPPESFTKRLAELSAASNCGG
jgi:TolA-binding protein